MAYEVFDHETGQLVEVNHEPQDNLNADNTKLNSPKMNHLEKGNSSKDLKTPTGVISEHDKILQDIKSSLTRSLGVYMASIYRDIEIFNDYPISRHHVAGTKWAVYYDIFMGMISKNYKSLDAMSVDTFVQANASMEVKKQYDLRGGYESIYEVQRLSDEDNVFEYYETALSTSALVRLDSIGVDIVSDYELTAGMNHLEISQFYEGKLAEIFADDNLQRDTVKDMSEGILEVFSDAERGINKGLPLNSALLNDITKGQITGNITMLAGMSGVGKTFLTICLTIPQIISAKEPVLIMCNEEEMAMWQMQLVIYVANNFICPNGYYNGSPVEITKHRFYTAGEHKFTDAEWDALRACEEWIQDKMKGGLIKFINFQSFSMDKAIALVKQYSTKYNVRYFILDTMKLDNSIGSKGTDMAWLHLQQGMVKLYNVIKKSNRDVHVWVTYQLNKTNQRHLDMTSLGMSKNVVDVVSTLLLVRNVQDSEKDMDKKLKVMGTYKNEIQLDKDKDYMLVFVDKNRHGQTTDVVVLQTDKNRNTVNDVGLTKIGATFSQ